MPRVNQKPKPVPAPEDLDAETALREFRKAQDLLKAANERVLTLKTALVDYIHAYGEPDDKGNLWVELDSGAKLKHEKRTSQVLDTDLAEKLAKKYKVDVTETIEVFSEDKFLAAGYEKKIPDAAVQDCYTERVTWAFVPKDA